MQYPYGRAWCYLHPEGLKTAGGVVCTPYKGRLPTHYYDDGVIYEVCNAEVCNAYNMHGYQSHSYSCVATCCSLANVFAARIVSLVSVCHVVC